MSVADGGGMMKASTVRNSSTILKAPTVLSKRMAAKLVQ